MRTLRAILLMMTVMMIVITLLLPSPARAATPEEEIRAADARRIAAVVQGDVTTLAALLTEDLTYTHSNGKLETREQFLAGISAGTLDYKSIEPSDVQVRVYGGSAVMTGRAAVKVMAEGKDRALAMRFTSVWVRSEGGWRMAAWQSTSLP